MRRATPAERCRAAGAALFLLAGATLVLVLVRLGLVETGFLDTVALRPAPPSSLHAGHAAVVTPSSVRWLHIPKAGSSFANVLVTWACANVTDVDMIGRETQRPGSTPGNLIDPWVKRHGATKCPTPGFKLSGGHAPLSAADWRDTGEGGTVVAMFRRPSDRLRSAHRRKGQPFGCRGQPASCAIHYLSEQRGCQLRMLNGISCVASLENRAKWAKVKRGSAKVIAETTRRIERFGFVGLTHEWALSVCLFHAQFGGRAHHREFVNIRPGLAVSSVAGAAGAADTAVEPNRPPTLAGELVDRRAELANGTRGQRYGPGGLGGSTPGSPAGTGTVTGTSDPTRNPALWDPDPWDDPVYAAADRVFWRRVRKHAVTGSCARAVRR